MRLGKIKTRFSGRAASYSSRSFIVVTIGLVVLLAGGGAVLAQLGGAPKLSSSSDIALSKGLIGWWKLDGNTKDSTAYGRNGTSASTANVADRKGMANGALSFDGSSSYMVVNNFDSTVMSPANFSSSWTLSVWAKEGASQGAEKVLIGKLGCNGGIVTDGSNGYRFQLFDSACSTRTSIDATPANPTTSWHLLTATYSNGAMGYYLDGQLVSTASVSTMYNYPATTLGIGAANSTPSWVFNGSLDDARVYNRAINASEVMAIYKSYNDPLDAAQGESGLVGWWKFDGNAKDSSPYGDDGTVNGASLTADRKNRGNSAYSFNGTTAYISAPDAGQLDNTSMTASLWLDLSSTLDCDGNNNWRSLISKGSQSATTTGWDVVIEENMGVQFDVGYGGATHRSGGVNVGLSPGTPTLLTFTYDAATGTRNIYANGVLKNTATLGANAISSNAQPLNISKGTNTGACPAGPGYVPGTYDDVRLYNRALSQSEIQNLYNSYDSVVALGGSNGPVQLGKGLVGDWPMNGNAKDNTPYGDNGTVTAATLTTDRKGRANSAYSFDQTTTFITLANNAALKPTQGISVGAWVKPTNMSSTTEQKIVSATESGSYSIAITGSSADGNCNANSLCFFLDINGTAYRVVQTARTALTNGNWYYISATYDGTSLVLYVNGSSVASGSYTGPITEANAPLCIGAEAGAASCNGGQYFAGTIDDVRIWNRGLSQAEITALYNEYR